MATETVTDPQGVVHDLAAPGSNATVCGQSAIGWSRAITIPQLVGLVLYCERCRD